MVDGIRSLAFTLTMPLFVTGILMFESHLQLNIVFGIVLVLAGAISLVTVILLDNPNVERKQKNGKENA